MITAFWISLFLVAYTYVGYGCLLCMLVKIKNIIFRGKHPQCHDIPLPSVTVITAACNESGIIREKIANCLSLDYPPHLLRLLFVTDGSTDGTQDIIKETGGLDVLHEPERLGKGSAIARVMKTVNSDVTVFTDANAMLNRGAIKELVKHFGNPGVGAVAGEKRISAGNLTGTSTVGEGFYWKYESALKRLDYELYTNVGAAGELFSIRTSLYEQHPPDTVIEDHVLAMRIAERGWLVAYEPDAYSVERGSYDLRGELERKIRTCAGGIQSILRLKLAPNPFFNPVLAFQYLSHRVMRWIIAPPLLPVIFFLNALICAKETAAPVYSFLMGSQCVFYSLATAGWCLEKTKTKFRLFQIPFYFCFMNFAALAGAFRYFFKGQPTAWEMVKRN